MTDIESTGAPALEHDHRDRTAAPSRPTVMFVIGMGRSGTSALTRVLSLCGAELPATLLGANDGNPLGHWEPQSALEFNDAFLLRYGAGWHDPTLRLQGEVALGDAHCAAYLDQIVAFLRSMRAAPLLVIKEPRITALSAFWFEAARRVGSSIRVVVPVRHPQEVTASLQARDGVSPELSSALWLKYNLLAERASRAIPRVFVEYASLLRDWRTEISRIAAALSVDLSDRDEAAIEGFLRHDLRRQRHYGEISDAFGLGWTCRVYRALSDAARDKPVDTAALDEIFDSYRASERTFRVAIEEFRTRFVPGPPLHTPNITKLILEVADAGSQTLKSCVTSPWYRARNPDVFAAGCDPYKHWVTHGAEEGRLPCDDPLALLDKLIQERMTRPATPPQGMSAGPRGIAAPTES